MIREKEMIYKYFPVSEYSLQVLSDNKLWASHPSKFNDPFDSVFSVAGPAYNLIKDYVNKKAICCFSRNVESILMWSHYADNHRGFCIGFDANKFLWDVLLEDVRYTEKFPSFDTNDFLNPTMIEGKARQRELVSLFTTKYKDWIYEKEVRVILELDPDNKRPAETWEGRSFPISPDAVKHIYFGCKMPMCDKEKIREIIAARQVKFFDMNSSGNDFKLVCNAH